MIYIYIYNIADREKCDPDVLSQLDKYHTRAVYWLKKIKSLGWKKRTNEDRKNYLKWLKEYRKEHGL